MPLALPESARRMVDGPNIAHVATVMRDGSPQVTPVWIDRDGDVVLINTAAGRLKVRNVDRDPRVAISIVDRDHPNPPMLLRGRVVAVVDGDAAWEHYDKLRLKYSGRSGGERRAGEERIVWRIEADQLQAPEPRQRR